MIVTRSYNIGGGKNPLKIASFGDAHGALLDISFVSNLIDELMKIDPHLIFFAGDMLEGRQYKNINNVAAIIRALEMISKNVEAPVYVIMGNHDIRGQKLERLKTIYNGFEGVENVHFLFDESAFVDIKGMRVRIDAIDLGDGYYSTVWTRFVSNLKGRNFVCDVYNLIHDKIARLNRNNESYDKKFLLIHEAKTIILNDELFADMIGDYDAVYCAHMHSGYVPECLIKKAGTRKWNFKDDPTRGVYYSTRNVDLPFDQKVRKDDKTYFTIVCDEGLSRLNFPVNNTLLLGSRGMYPSIITATLV